MNSESNSTDAKRSAEERALDKFAEMLIEKLKGMSVDWKKPWFTEGALAWPKNADGRDYNGMNALMLLLHCENNGYKVPVFLTFDRVAGLNYKGGRKTGSSQVLDREGQPLPQVSVNKGAKSFPVFLTTFTVVNPDSREKIKYDDYKKLSTEEKAQYKVFPKLNVFNVFNVDQTNIAEARPDLYKKIVDSVCPQRTEAVKAEGEMFSFPALDHMISHNEWICPIKPTYGDDAYFSISKNEIVVPEKRQFKDGESFYVSLGHEMAHSTGAENQLNRLKPSTFGSAEYAREELVAEISAALIAQRYGMSKTIKDDSIPYLKNWLDSLQESPDFIKTTLTDVKKATGMIVERIEKVSLELSVHPEIAEQNEIKNIQSEERLPVSGSTSEVAAKDVGPKDIEPTSQEISKYAIYCGGTGRYVSYVANPVVRFADMGQALLFDNRDAAKAVARECRYYMPDERFTVREVKGLEEVRDPAQNSESFNRSTSLKDLGKYSVPEWALNYMVNGDAEGLTPEEIAIVDEFTSRNFPNGFVMSIDWDDTNEFNRYPAFGTRDESALTNRGESPYQAVKTIMVQFFDAIQREKKPQLNPDELGVLSHPNKNIWQVQLMGGYDFRDLMMLKDRARQMGGIPSSDQTKFYFLDEQTARRYNYFPGAFQNSVTKDTEFEPAKKDISSVGESIADRLSDLVVELRGERREPWLTGKVDEVPVVAEKLSTQEFRDYIAEKITVHDLGVSHFQSYLNQSQGESHSIGIGI